MDRAIVYPYHHNKTFQILSRDSAPIGSLHSFESGYFPYPFHYRIAFAFSDFPCLLTHRLFLREAFHIAMGVIRFSMFQHFNKNDLESACSPEELWIAQSESGALCPYLLPFGQSLSAYLAYTINDVYQQFTYVTHIILPCPHPVSCCQS
jgi:hypothetical protein